MAAGSYTFTAQATDNQGANTTSAAVTVTVNALPTVTLTSPANNAVFTAPATITLTANAADADGTITQVEFFQGTTLLATLTTAPYTFALNNVAAGVYTFTAKATDNQGANTTSAAVTVTVNALPTITLTSPANGASFTAPASITVTAVANDSDGTITQVELFQGATLLATLTVPPYTTTLNNVQVGSYTFTARGTDNFGGVTTSDAVTVTVASGVAQLYFIYTDQLNTPRVITDQTNKVVWKWDQADPFGGNVPDENPSGLGTFTCNLRLPGQYFDKETGLSQNWMRDYDPGIGRYVESDPIGVRGGINSYAYVGNSPLRFFDPSGLEPWNGNFVPGLRRQEPGCDVVGGPPLNFNANECARQCCAEHDDCYARFGCNVSSWAGNQISLTIPIATLVFARLPCPICNARVIVCLVSAPFRNCGGACAK